MVELINVNKFFDKSIIINKNYKSNSTFSIKNINIKCHAGRVFSLIGPNGAGKTTILRMIATLIAPSSGSIIIDNINVKNHPNEIRRKIGFLTGSTHLYERLTATEIVNYFATLQGLNRSEINQQRNLIFENLKIHDFANKKIGQLSTGMKQRVSIARSIIHNPEILIFDEPTSGIDIVNAQSIISLIRQFKEENKTVIFSSHIMSEVDLLSDDIAIIKDGEIIYNNSFEEFKILCGKNSITEQFINFYNKIQY